MAKTDTASEAAIKPAAWGEEQFGAFYQENARAIFYLALRYLGDPTQAEDVTHDVFLKAYQHRQQFRGDAHPRTWLYRITINHCKNLIHSWSRRHLVSLPEDVGFQEQLAGTEEPLKSIEVKELGQRIQRTLDMLPSEYRLLLLLIADERLSYQEVANLTQQTADAVRGKLHRARKAFIQKFQSIQ